MSGDPVLLDTNIVINHFRDRSLFSSQLLASNYFLPRVVIGELYSGAFRSARADHHCSMIEQFASFGEVLEIDERTSREYGKIWAQLAQKGRLIPTNDIWIAALALQHGLKLISLDFHFEEVEQLSWERWLE